MLDGRYHDAISLLESNLETNPNDVQSIEIMARVYLSAGDVKTAVKNFRKVLSIDSSNSYAYALLERLSEGNNN